MSILDSLLSIASGGITGLVGTALQSYYTFQSKKLDIELEKSKFSHELEQRRLDAEIMEKEYVAKTHIAEITTNADVDKSDGAVLAASYAIEPQQYSEKSLLTHAQNWILVFLDAFRAIIRPSLTLYLAGLTTIIYLQARTLMGTDLPIDAATALVTKIIDTILYVTTTAILWYFGSRVRVKK